MTEGVQLTPPSWIDKDFIQKALQVGEEDPSISVLSFNISMAHAMGDGNTSDMYRVVAELSNSQQRRLIIKCEPQGGSREELVKKSDIFHRETKMLTETLPAMYKLLQEAKPDAYPPFAAKCFYHGKEPVQFLVLEDLRQPGFTITDRKKGLDLAHCKLALETLARFHASSLVLVHHNPTALQSYENPFYNEEREQELGPFFENIIHSLENIVLEWPGYEKYSEKIRPIRENIYRYFVQELRVKHDVNTLLHSDLWTGNMMFKYYDSNVTDLRLVDFQACYYSSPAIDLQHFLSNCPNADVRDLNMDYLIEEYHRIFSETLNLLNCPVGEITIEALKNELEKHALYGLIIAGVYLPLSLTDPSEEKWDLNDLLGQKETKTNSWERAMRSEPYKRMITKMLTKCEKLGVL